MQPYRKSKLDSKTYEVRKSIGFNYHKEMYTKFGVRISKKTAKRAK